MKRDLETILELWQKDSRRRPLLLRGARQVGKTFTVMQFGKSHFDNVAEINFEQGSLRGLVSILEFAWNSLFQKLQFIQIKLQADSFNILKLNFFLTPSNIET